jgi:DNA-binding winged helix-turn-helix (wHTH) protein
LGPLTLDRDCREAIAFGRSVQLTRMECDLLAALMDAPGRAFSRADLLSILHGLDGRTPTERALDNLVVRLRRKLKDDSRHPRLIQAVWGVGYRLIAPSAEAGVELARQAIDLLPMPAFLIARDRTVVCANASGRRVWNPLPERVPCYDLFQCRAGGRSLKDHCCGLETMARKVPAVRDYLVSTATGPAPMHALYLPISVGQTTMCLLLLTAV